MIQRYPSGKNGAEDSCQRVTYTYDTNSVNPSFSQYSQKRLTTAQYSVCAPGRITPVTEMYSYHAAGAVTSKQLQFQRCSGTCSTVYQKADYTYDSAGRTATYGISGSLTNTSQAPPVPIVYTYGYDSMGRPATLTDNFGQWATGGQNIIWAKNGQYDFAGRMTSLQTLSAVYYPLFQTTYTTQQMTWNVNGQLTSQNWGAGGVQYVYSSTQNNGQITQAVDTLSGETIGYQYDALKRLISASGAPNAGTTPAAWNQSFQYDGFGNLTGKTLNGTTTPIAVDATTNKLTNSQYDLNGNMTTGVGATFSYDEANRLFSAALTSGGIEYYGYAPDNKRVYRLRSDGTEEWTLYGAKAEKLLVYRISGSPGAYFFNIPASATVWFAGRLISENSTFGMFNSAVIQDRLGTNRVNGARFYPYGEEIGAATANDHVKFGTYNRDGYSGLDYADQRYYASAYGRFTTTDPYGASGGPSDPSSWNRYSYTPRRSRQPFRSGRAGGRRWIKRLLLQR